MKIISKSAKLTEVPCDLLIVNLFQGIKKPGGATGSVDSKLSNLITKIIKDEDFKGKQGEIITLRTLGKIPAQIVLVVGLGKKQDFTTETIRRVTATAISKAKNYRAKNIVSILHGAGVGNISAYDSALAITTGAMLASYTFTKYQSDKAKSEAKKVITSLTIVDHNPSKIRSTQLAVKLGIKLYKGTSLVRNLVNEPGLDVTPTRLVKEAESIAVKSPQISLKVFDEQKLKHMGANAILAVSRGSQEPAYMIHLIYKPKTKALKKIALVGKGLTFDTGGYSLKPTNGMDTMKIDMAGGATVLGIFQVLTQLDINIEVHGIIPTSENLISGRAIKPGDIITALNGKTIEILNTDAEGRLILADALSYLKKQKWDAVIDLATLTGACVVALGENIAGLFTKDKNLLSQLLQASKLESEPFWSLPLPDDYKPLIKSKIADLQNIGKSKWGGAITAALFLQEFVPKKTPWAHVDIAGPAYEEKGSISYLPVGGTGFGVRTIIRYLQNLS